jgi:transcriptional regulator with GAF, ATPase, and Fis domain
MPISDIGALRRVDPIEFRKRIVDACAGKNIEKAAEALGISRRMLQYYMRDLGLSAKRKDVAPRN